MARIRAIKPEFWSSPDHPADPWARLLYIAMWNWADDAGVGTANLKELAGFAFPNDDEIETGAMRRLCADIAAHYGATFYTVAGRPYYSIPTWKDHQKFDNRRGGKHPGPEQADAPLDLHEPKKPARCADSAPTMRRTTGAPPAPEQGNRGTGEQGNSYPPTPQAEGGSLLPATRTKTGDRLQALSADAISEGAMGIARGYAGWCEGGIDRRTQDEIAREVTPLLDDGLDPRQIAEGIKAWHASNSWHPNQLRRFVTKAAPAGPKVGKPTRKAQTHIDAAEAVIAAMADM